MSLTIFDYLFCKIIQLQNRDRKTFMSKMASKDFKTLKAYIVALDNFENFCMINKRGLDKDTV
ncbi:MAG: hypothetical protein H0Z55_05250 [Nitrosarchaeum sp.]|nr:hypothetical protein [Nitrosarchaeum sp.]